MKGKEGEADLFYAQEWIDPSYKPNARYMKVNNSMYILSINLIEPIFDLQMCDALKYSVMGASTIGHEITHGFDSDGSLYNKLGKKDEHAPFCLRVNGNVYLMDEFYRLFNIKSGQMYLDPKDRIEIW